MRSPCCLCANLSQRVGIAEPEKTAVTSQRLVKDVLATASTHETIELLELCFICSPRRIRYSVYSERKAGD
jgi:hypothetical protein